MECTGSLEKNRSTIDLFIGYNGRRNSRPICYALTRLIVGFTLQLRLTELRFHQQLMKLIDEKNRLCSCVLQEFRKHKRRCQHSQKILNEKKICMWKTVEVGTIL